MNEIIQENEKLKFEVKRLSQKNSSLIARNKRLEDDLKALRPFGMHIYSLNNDPDKIRMPCSPNIVIPVRASVNVTKDINTFSWRIMAYLDKPDYLSHNYYVSDMELLRAKDRVELLEELHFYTMAAFNEKLK